MATPPEECVLIVIGDALGRERKTGPIEVVVVGVRLGMSLALIEVSLHALGQMAKPLLNFSVLLRSAGTAVAHFEIGNGGATENPILDIDVLEMRHLAGPGIGFRSRVEERVDTSGGCPASFGEVGIGSQTGVLSKVRGAIAGLFVGGLFHWIDDGRMGICVVGLGIEDLGKLRRSGALVRSIGRGDAAIVPWRMQAFGLRSGGSEESES